MPKAPFQYGPPTSYDSNRFNPKVVSQASLLRASLPPSPSEPQKPKGPLINFNKHPDSYQVLPFRRTNVAPMHPRTKKAVTYTRWLQLLLRCCELVGSAGLLVCTICLQNIPTATGWIIRIPPGVAILHCIYAIYHLARQPNRRTPASSASYMLFAAVSDLALIPFAVFTALNSHAQELESASTKSRWTSLFGGDEVADKLIQSTFLVAVTNGGMHLVSLIISLYLANTFRKISNLPPDMNPLEDNLTSRRYSKQSSLSEKHLSQATTFSIVSGDSTDNLSPKRGSQVQDPLLPGPNVAFMHTRMDSSNSLGTVRRYPVEDSHYESSPSGQAADHKFGRSSRRGSLLDDTWFAHTPSPNSRAQNDQHGEYDRDDPYIYYPQDTEYRKASYRPTPPKHRVLQTADSNSVRGSPVDGVSKGKAYGELKAGPPPVMGNYVDLPPERYAGGRAVSNSGADVNGRREVSGKMAEEGRASGPKAWVRWRKVSSK